MNNNLKDSEKKNADQMTKIGASKRIGMERSSTARIRMTRKETERWAAIGEGRQPVRR